MRVDVTFMRGFGVAFAVLASCTTDASLPNGDCSPYRCDRVYTQEPKVTGANATVSWAGRVLPWHEPPLRSLGALWTGTVGCSFETLGKSFETGPGAAPGYTSGTSPSRWTLGRDTRLLCLLPDRRLLVATPTPTAPAVPGALELRDIAPGDHPLQWTVSLSSAPDAEPQVLVPSEGRVTAGPSAPGGPAPFPDLVTRDYERDLTFVVEPSASTPLLLQVHVVIDHRFCGGASGDLCMPSCPL